MSNTHRWNIERVDGGLLICDGEHEKLQGCNYVKYVPESQLTDLREKVEKQAKYIKALEELTVAQNANLIRASQDQQQVLFDKDAAEKLSMCGAEVEVLREKLRVAEGYRRWVLANKEDILFAMGNWFKSDTQIMKWLLDLFDGNIRPTSNPIAERAVEALIHKLEDQHHSSSSESAIIRIIINDLRAILSQLQENPQ